jgi:hypothetical protein
VRRHVARGDLKIVRRQVPVLDAHAAIISVSATGGTLDALRARLVPVHELKHVTIESETAEALAARGATLSVLKESSPSR